MYPIFISKVGLGSDRVTLGLVKISVYFPRRAVGGGIEILGAKTTFLGVISPPQPIPLTLHDQNFWGGKPNFWWGTFPPKRCLE